MANRLLIAIFCILSLSPRAFGGLREINFKCGPNGALKSYSQDGITTYTFGKPLETGAPLDQENKFLDIKYPLSGPNKKQTGQDYLRHDIEDLVEAAIDEDVDPFLALSIVILENNPVKSNETKYKTRRSNYGMPPIDAIALATELACNNTDEKRTSDLLEEGTCSLPHFQTGKFEHLLCSSEMKIGNGAYMKLLPKETVSNPKCCTLFRSNSPKPPTSEIISSHYGMKFMKQKIQDNIPRDERLSYSIQRFNGRGCLGCTEALKNDCFRGIHMGDRPLYGARVADLMANALMTNPGIVEMVARKQRERKKDVVSVFCLKKGSGTHSMPSDFFWQLQYDYLMEGAEGNYRAYVDNKAVTLENQKDVYKDTELNRRRECSHYFANQTPDRPQSPEGKETTSKKDR